MGEWRFRTLGETVGSRTHGESFLTPVELFHYLQGAFTIFVRSPRVLYLPNQNVAIGKFPQFSRYMLSIAMI